MSAFSIHQVVEFTFGILVGMSKFTRHTRFDVKRPTAAIVYATKVQKLVADEQTVAKSDVCGPLVDQSRLTEYFGHAPLSEVNVLVHDVLGESEKTGKASNAHPQNTLVHLTNETNPVVTMSYHRV